MNKSAELDKLFSEMRASLNNVEKKIEAQVEEVKEEVEEKVVKVEDEKPSILQGQPDIIDVIEELNASPVSDKPSYDVFEGDKVDRHNNTFENESSVGNQHVKLKIENLDEEKIDEETYRENLPYDAMGDYSAVTQEIEVTDEVKEDLENKINITLDEVLNPEEDVVLSTEQEEMATEFEEYEEQVKEEETTTEVDSTESSEEVIEEEPKNDAGVVEETTEKVSDEENKEDVSKKDKITNIVLDIVIVALTAVAGYLAYNTFFI